MNWYHLDDQRERRGPFDEAEIAAMIPDGRLKADTLVWNETLADWIQAGESRLSSHFAQGTPPPPPAIPPPVPGGSLPGNQSRGCRPRLIAVIAAGIVLLTLLIAIISAKACSTGSAADMGNGRPNYYQQQVEMMANMCRTCVGRGRLQTTCRGCGGAGTINTPSGYTSDIDCLSRLLKRTPEALRHPVAARSDEAVPISLRVSGAIPAKDWRPPLVEAILREELPILFLPHFTGAVEIPEGDLKLFETFAFLYRAHIHNPQNPHCIQSGNHAVDQRLLPGFGWLRDLEVRLWDRLNQIPFPGFRYFIMETLHRLEAASWRLIQDFARPGTTHEMMCPWAEDLLWCAARSLEISVESLGFHGIGIQARDTQLPLPKALAFIRSHPDATGVTPRQVDRHFGIRKEARDRVLDELQRLGLAIRYDRRVVATRFDEFIHTLVEDPSIPHRRLSLIDLADTKPDPPPYADLQHLAARS